MNQIQNWWNGRDDVRWLAIILKISKSTSVGNIKKIVCSFIPLVNTWFKIIKKLLRNHTNKDGVKISQDQAHICSKCIHCALLQNIIHYYTNGISNSIAVYQYRSTIIEMKHHIHFILTHYTSKFSELKFFYLFNFSAIDNLLHRLPTEPKHVKVQ